MLLRQEGREAEEEGEDREELYRLAQEKYPGTTITKTIAKEYEYKVLFIPHITRSRRRGG